jgi:hypothetical protein
MVKEKMITKQDVGEIVGKVVRDSEDRMTGLFAKQFKKVDGKFEGVYKKFDDFEASLNYKIDTVYDNLDAKIDKVNENLGTRIDGLSRRIDDLALNRATNEQVLILGRRVDRIEEKIGLKNK